VNGLADPRRIAPRARGDACALGREQPGGLEPDPAGRAGYDAEAVAKAKIHAGGSVQRVTTILLARHGETDWNRERRYQGHADEPLNETGRAQARELGDRLREEPITAVYSSDLQRASETAAIVARILGLPVELDPRLREIDVGSWQGRTHEELDATPWDGETYDEHRVRVVAAVQSIARAHPGECVLLVVHGGTLRRTQEAATGEGLPVYENCGVWAVAVEDGEFRPID
jgi:probable phosphoglycerate mutase